MKSRILKVSIILAIIFILYGCGQVLKANARIDKMQDCYYEVSPSGIVYITEIMGYMKTTSVFITENGNYVRYHDNDYWEIWQDTDNFTTQEIRYILPDPNS